MKRSLETLRHAGYVRYSADSGSYSLAFRVRRLSENFRDELWITEVASPLLRKLTAKILWPSDLVTLEEDELVVRDATHPLSPLSFSTNVFGVRLPILRTAVGRAYLSFCPDEERDVLLEMLRARDDDEGVKARDARYVRRVIETTRRRGYAINERGEGVGKGKLGTIAVPIRWGERIIGCINIVHLMRAASSKEIVDRYLEDLFATAREIEAGIARLRNPKSMQ